MCVCSVASVMSDFVTPWIVAYQAPLCMGFPRQEYWSVLPCPPPGDLPNPGIEPTSLAAPVLQVDSLPLSYQKESESEVPQSYPTLCDPMDGSLPGSTIHGIFQARILEWAAISFSRGSSQPRDQTRVSCIADRRFTV